VPVNKEVHAMEIGNERKSVDEFSVMQTINEQLEALEEQPRDRVLVWLFSKFGQPTAVPQRQRVGGTAQLRLPAEELKDQVGNGSSFSTFAELYEAARPDSQSSKALVSGYWLQVCEGAESFASQTLNDQLKNLGQGVGNITQALEHLKRTQPALILQLKKSGKSQQSRKTYKLTVAGIKAVEAMIAGAEA
jgi:hypothetical protein